MRNASIKQFHPVLNRKQPKTIKATTKKHNLIAAQQVVASLLGYRIPTDGDVHNPYLGCKWLYHKSQTTAILNGEPNNVTPVNAEFVPSLECNFACATCPYRCWKNNATINKSQRFIDVKLAKHIFEELQSFNVRGITFTGGGEPTTHKDLVEMMRYAGDSCDLELALFTNGSLLTGHLVDNILGIKKLVILRISLNAIDPNLHSTFHGYSSTDNYFNRVTENLRYIARTKRNMRMRLASNFQFGVAFIVGKRNYNSLNDIGQYIRSLVFDGNERVGDIDYVVFRPEIIYHQYKSVDDQQSIQAQHSSQYFTTFLDIFRSKIKPDLETIDGLNVIANEQRFHEVNDTQQQRCRSCLGHPWRTNIAPDGKVYLCTENNGNPIMEIGDLSKQTLEDIWSSERRQQVIANLDSFFHKSCPLYASSPTTIKCSRESQT